MQHQFSGVPGPPQLGPGIPGIDSVGPWSPQGAMLAPWPPCPVCHLASIRDLMEVPQGQTANCPLRDSSRGGLTYGRLCLDKFGVAGFGTLCWVKNVLRKGLFGFANLPLYIDITPDPFKIVLDSECTV